MIFKLSLELHYFTNLISDISQAKIEESLSSAVFGGRLPNLRFYDFFTDLSMQPNDNSVNDSHSQIILYLENLPNSNRSFLVLSQSLTVKEWKEIVTVYLLSFPLLLSDSMTNMLAVDVMIILEYFIKAKKDEINSLMHPPEYRKLDSLLGKRRQHFPDTSLSFVGK